MTLANHITERLDNTTTVDNKMGDHPAGKLRWNDVETTSCTDVVSTLKIDADVLVIST